MSAGTAGTITGVGKYLKEKNPSIKVILVDIIGSIIKGFVENGKINPNDNKDYLVEGIG